MNGAGAESLLFCGRGTIKSGPVVDGNFASLLLLQRPHLLHSEQELGQRFHPALDHPEEAQRILLSHPTLLIFPLELISIVRP